MTQAEALIARIAFRLGMEQAMTLLHEEVADDTSAMISDRFVKVYEPDKPCFYMRECVATGRCPRDPVCDN